VDRDSPEVDVNLSSSTAIGLESQSRLFVLLYSELRRLAAFNMQGERASHTLTPTALVHEAWLRMPTESKIAGRNHFMAVASQAMRRILVDHARARLAIRRGKGNAPFSIQLLDIAEPTPPKEIIALNDALDRLSAIKPRAARVIEFRFFGGMTEEEIAVTLNVTRRTVNRDWETARVWLFSELHAADGR
jgi:RNA polymerase sigma-70 factor (ECF subfamily)